MALKLQNFQSVRWLGFFTLNVFLWTFNQSEAVYAANTAKWKAPGGYLVEIADDGMVMVRKESTSQPIFLSKGRIGPNSFMNDQKGLKFFIADGTLFIFALGQMLKVRNELDTLTLIQPLLQTPSELVFIRRNPESIDIYRIHKQDSKFWTEKFHFGDPITHPDFFRRSGWMEKFLQTQGGEFQEFFRERLGSPEILPADLEDIELIPVDSYMEDMNEGPRLQDIPITPYEAPVIVKKPVTEVIKIGAWEALTLVPMDRGEREFQVVDHFQLGTNPIVRISKDYLELLRNDKAAFEKLLSEGIFVNFPGEIVGALYFLHPTEPPSDFVLQKLKSAKPHVYKGSSTFFNFYDLRDGKLKKIPLSDGQIEKLQSGNLVPKTAREFVALDSVEAFIKKCQLGGGLTQ